MIWGGNPLLLETPICFFLLSKIKSRIDQAGILRKQQEHFFGALVKVGAESTFGQQHGVPGDSEKATAFNLSKNELIF